MMEFTEDHCRTDLFPISLTRSVADIRVGVFTIREKWDLCGLSIRQPVPANLVPSPAFMDMASHEGLDAAMAATATYKRFQYPWDLPSLNAWAIEQDIALRRRTKASSPLPASLTITGDPGGVFIEEGARIEHAYMNTLEGPIYIGAGALVMDGAMLRGPVSIGANAIVKMGAAIYGGTTVGPNCTVGGEIKNSILLGNSNKGHEGYLGDAVIGEWCNLGAGTSCSNLRNAIAPVKIWHMASQQWHLAGTKCGLIMGDHVTCSINSSFNTGSVVGVCANIFQPGALLPKFIPNFSWGAGGTERYRLDKALENILAWMALKNAVPDQTMIHRLTDIFNQDK